ncbi:hypothetical protein Cpa01nite_01000 [Cellulomonas pakistanensis]|uniref:Uncharacterized protein n=2 Tax=Cellulomonas pakistanensis TaxID=992287 RepID=A0A919U431_9CELL|nr:hypothetical protein Cpa01nite_01000 [Cellulomonas pakistanensis]
MLAGNTSGADVWTQLRTATVWGIVSVALFSVITLGAVIGLCAGLVLASTIKNIGGAEAHEFLEVEGEALDRPPDGCKRSPGSGRRSLDFCSCSPCLRHGKDLNVSHLKGTSP